VYRRVSDVVSVRLDLRWDGRSLSESWTYGVSPPPQQPSVDSTVK